jgi:hypothetical protein
MMNTSPVSRSEAEAIAREVMSLEVKPIVFELEQVKEELRQLNEGERVVIPQNKEHAKFMLIMAMNYLGIKPGEPIRYE